MAMVISFFSVGEFFGQSPVGQTFVFVHRASVEPCGQTRLAERDGPARAGLKFLTYLWYLRSVPRLWNTDDTHARLMKPSKGRRG